MIRYFRGSFFRFYTRFKSFIYRHIPKKRRLFIKRIMIAVISVFILYSTAYVIILFGLSSKIDEILLPIAESEARIIVENCVNDAVLSSSDSTISPIKIIYDNSNNVSSVITDTSYINRLKAEIGQYIENELRKTRCIPIKIPIGSLFSNHATSGRGFTITVRVLSPSYITTDTQSKFSSAGINQTIHRIIINVNVGFTIMLPLGSHTFNIESSVCTSETIIVGTVPSAIIDG